MNSNGTVNGTVTTGKGGTTVAAVTFVVSPTTATVTINGSTLRSNESIKLAPGTYPYTVTASGYQTASGSVTVDNAAQTFTINLLPMPVDPTYNVTITRPVNGAVTASATSGVRPGSTVTLTVTPDRGYALSALTIRGSGASVPYSSLGNGRYSFVMPEGGVTVSAVFTRIRFTDVPAGEWYYNAVYWAVENGVTDGTSDTLFSPGRDVTRAEMVTFLWRAAGCPEPTTTVNPFEDVSSSAYYYDAVLWAVENGITDGVSDTEFDPTGECTRAQMVTFLWRAENEPDVGTSNPFEDVDEEEYYYEAILWAAANGITDGMTDTTFVPGGNCTRAQAVTFLYRTMV